MNTTHNKRKMSITLDNSVYDRLPKRDRSAYINLVLKQHYQKEAFEEIYQGIKQRLLKDQDINEWMIMTAKEVRGL